MDLSPFYELRARLHDGAMAGAALAAEDFRLRRALDAFSPLEAVPVFQKLGQLTRALLAPDCPDRPGALLDALTLADAVACTQGAVAVPGPVEPLGLSRRGTAVTNAPYSVLAPLLEALTTSGGGKYSFVAETHDQRPELFRDYRVQDALVQALGAAYAELADKAETWLSAEDAHILPLLQNGFDPAGKRAMVRRVHVMEAVAGAEANDFYLSQLDHAEKEVRAALIYALRHSEDNVETLIELCKTEKGKCKAAAHWALAKLDAPAAWEYWEKLSVKKPGQAAEYMALSTTEKASALVADALDRWLAPCEADPAAPMGKQEMDQLQTLLLALPGKSGPAICKLYRRMAALGTALDNKSYPSSTGGRTMAVRFLPHADAIARDAVPFSEALPLMLQQSIILNPTDDLLALAEELGQSPAFTTPRLTALLLSQPADIAYAAAEPLLTPTSLFQKKRQKWNQALLLSALSDIWWDFDHHCLAYSAWFHDPASDRPLRYQRPLREPLDHRWYQALIHLGANEQTDETLDRLLDLDDPELRAQLGSYFYKRALTVEDNQPYLPRLWRCGWPTCQGLLESYCKRRKVSSWEVQAYLTQMPGTRGEITAEAQRVLALVEAKKIAVSSWNPSHIQAWLENDKNFRKFGGTT